MRIGAFPIHPAWGRLGLFLLLGLSCVLSLRAANAVVEFSGARGFTEEQLREALVEPLEAIRREGLTAATADDAAFFLELFYRKGGYTRVLVKYTIVSGTRLRLAVEEGVAVQLGDLVFSGVRAFPDDRLREYLLAPTYTSIGEQRASLPFIASSLQAGRDSLMDFYRSQGFLDVQIANPVPRLRGDRADVLLVVQEGARYRFGKVETTHLPPAEPVPRYSWFRRKFARMSLLTPRQQLDRDLAELSSGPYTPDTAKAMANKVQDYLKKRGYYRAEVNVVTRRGANAVADVELAAHPGAIWQFGAVTVKGTDRLKPQYLRNRFGVLRGQSYSSQKLDEVFSEQMRTGLFRTLRTKLTPEEDGTLRIDLEVTEAKAREVGFSVGFSTFDGPLFGVEARDRDFLGTGRPIAIRLDYSARSFTGELVWEDPHWFETDFKLRLRVAATSRDLDSYTKGEIGFFAEVTRKLTKEIEVGIFSAARKVEISALKVSPAEAGLLSYFVSSLGVTAGIDLRNSPILPARGFAASVAADITSPGLGSDINLFRISGRGSYFVPLGKSTLAFGARAGALVPLGGGTRSAIPIDERFFNGGSTSVRSFAERRLGPRDLLTGGFVGGLSYTSFNAEYIFPIRGDLRGAVFYDAGSLSRGLGFGSMRQGIGAGIRYNLPIGPLRVDYGINPSRRPGESIGALHIAFGMAF